MVTAIPKKMSGILLIGHGGFEKLVYRTDLDVPELEANEVLVKVGGAAVNNTDINTRIGWHSIELATFTCSYSTAENDRTGTFLNLTEKAVVQKYL